jgi:hypothetical protein
MGTNVRRYHYRQNNRGFNGDFKNKRKDIRTLKILKRIANREEINRKIFNVLPIPVHLKLYHYNNPYLNTGSTSASNYYITWQSTV